MQTGLLNGMGLVDLFRRWVFHKTLNPHIPAQAFMTGWTRHVELNDVEERWNWIVSWEQLGVQPDAFQPGCTLAQQRQSTLDLDRLLCSVSACPVSCSARGLALFHSYRALTCPYCLPLHPPFPASPWQFPGEVRPAEAPGPDLTQEEIDNVVRRMFGEKKCAGDMHAPDADPDLVADDD